MSHWHRTPCPRCGRPKAARALNCEVCYHASQRLYSLEVTRTPAAKYVFALSVGVLMAKGYRRATCAPGDLRLGEFCERRQGERVELWWIERDQAKEAA